MAAITAKGSITNDQVEKLLHISDATATRYLSQLEKEGKLQQIGTTGKSVKYTKL
jgi:predicted HTH transcriptional regulator